METYPSSASVFQEKHRGLLWLLLSCAQAGLPYLIAFTQKTFINLSPYKCTNIIIKINSLSLYQTEFEISKGMAIVISKGSTKEEIKKKLSKQKQGVSKKEIRKFCGVLNLNMDPIKLQKKWRDEWE